MFYYVNSRHRDHIHSRHIICDCKTHACNKLSFLERQAEWEQMTVLEHVCIILVHIKSKAGREPPLPSLLGGGEGL